MGSQRNMNIGFAFAASATEQKTAPLIVLNCESADIGKAPIRAAQPNNITRQPLKSDGYGFDFTFTASGIITNAKGLGILATLALGGDSFATGAHTITPANSLPYCVVFLDKNVDLGGGKTTETLLGCKVEELKIEAVSKDFVKLSVSGKGCALGVNQASLTPSIPTAAADASLSWKVLRGGGLTTEYNGTGGMTADTTCRGLNITYKQPLVEEGNGQLGSDQPSGLNEGEVELAFDMTRGFGTGALTERTAFMNSQQVKIQAAFVIDTSSVVIAIPYGVAHEPGYEGGAGGSADEVMATIGCKAELDGANSLITISVIDGTAAAYATL